MNTRQNSSSSDGFRSPDRRTRDAVAVTPQGAGPTRSVRVTREDELEGGQPMDNELSHEELVEMMEAKDEEEADGGDSDVEGPECELYELTAEELKKESSVEAAMHSKDGNPVSIHRMSADGWNDISNGGHSEVEIPKPDPDWVPPAVKEKKGEPAFKDVDNPGDWDEFYFRPKFAKGSNGKYIAHQLPTGAIPVPKDKDGQRKHGDWEFHYKGFANEEKTFRRGASTTNLFPEEMKGCLDANLLRKLGLTKKRMEETDALFFYQLLLPICDPSKSGVEGDPRKPYYTEVERFTNASKCLSGAGSSYGHSWTQTTAAELLCHDGVLFMDGVLGGSEGALYQRWDDTSPMYSPHITNSMTMTRWCELKRNKKLCVNETAKKRGDPGYDPSYKFDLVYNCFVFNTNTLTKKADENQVLDESTYGHAGYGEAGSGIITRLTNKKVNKGGQVVLMMDRFRPRVRAYLHRHKLYSELFKEEKKKWSKNGTFELFYLSSKLLTMTDGDTSPTKKIFRRKPCITADNYFQDDAIMEWLGEQGLGGIMTTARDRLPSDIPSQYLHKQKTDAKNKGAKLARFAPPIIAVKTDKDKGFQRLHISFQSTSSCNISTVNALNEVFHIVEIRERGRGKNKRYWVIEMNNVRRIYLSTYNGVDVIDHYIDSTKLFYRSWKYWHAPLNHALSLVVACVYDFYLEAAEGQLDAEWKIENPVNYWQFRHKLCMQMLSYSPIAEIFPGDGRMRAVTKLPLQRRKMKEGISIEELKTLVRGRKSRGCGDLDALCHHVDSVKPLKTPRKCEWCGENAYHACYACEGDDGKAVPLHFTKKGVVTCKCFWRFHNDVCIGLGRGDTTKYMGKQKGKWREPTASQLKHNRAHILKLKRENRLK